MKKIVNVVLVGFSLAAPACAMVGEGGDEDESTNHTSQKKKSKVKSTNSLKNIRHLLGKKIEEIPIGYADAQVPDEVTELAKGQVQEASDRVNRLFKEGNNITLPERQERCGKFVNDEKEEKAKNARRKKNAETMRLFLAGLEEKPNV